jgi:hypothetical protein
MPRTNPNDQSPNPAKRWFLWKGDEGKIKYWDKETESEITVELPFEFILLDRLATVKGWHDASESGIYSNEVRKTTDEPFIVRAFKMKEQIASGFYSDIKDKIKSAGGRFNLNLYLAFTGDNGDLEIGSLILHGAPMSAWIELEKVNKKAVFEKGIIITGFKEGKKGAIKFRVPEFTLADIPPELDNKAGELQKILQTHLTRYLSRKTDSLDQTPKVEEEDISQAPPPDDDDEIPF